MPQIMEIITWLWFLKRCKQVCFRCHFRLGIIVICKLYWISLYWLCLVFMCLFIIFENNNNNNNKNNNIRWMNMMNYPMAFASCTRHYLADRRSTFSTCEWRQIVFITFFFYRLSRHSVFSVWYVWFCYSECYGR